MIRRIIILVMVLNILVVIVEFFVVIRLRFMEKDVYFRYVVLFGGKEKFGREEFFFWEV